MTIALSPTRRKYANEVRSYVFDFQNFPELIAGQTISAPSVPPVTGLVIGAPAVTTISFNPGEDMEIVPAGKGVSVTVSGGTTGTSYELACTVTTSGGATLTVHGLLEVS